MIQTIPCPIPVAVPCILYSPGVEQLLRPTPMKMIPNRMNLNSSMLYQFCCIIFIGLRFQHIWLDQCYRVVCNLKLVNIVFSTDSVDDSAVKKSNYNTINWDFLLTCKLPDFWDCRLYTSKK